MRLTFPPKEVTCPTHHSRQRQNWGENSECSGPVSFRERAWQRRLMFRRIAWWSLAISGAQLICTVETAALNPLSRPKEDVVAYGTPAKSGHLLSNCLLSRTLKYITVPFGHLLSLIMSQLVKLNQTHHKTHRPIKEPAFYNREISHCRTVQSRETAIKYNYNNNNINRGTLHMASCLSSQI